MHPEDAMLAPASSRPRRTPHRLARVALTAALALTAIPAWAQDAAGDQQGPTPAQMTADLLANLALETLTPATEDPSAVVPAGEDPAAGDPVRPDQYTRAQVLLDLALEQTPGDAELWRLRAGLAGTLGDQAAQTAALQHYIALRPGDDAMRLRLIMLELTELETLDGRLALLERYLDDTALPGRTPALISRLSSAAATAARELGDDARFVKHLRVAGRQGVANAEAAGLTLAFAESRGAAPAHLAAAAINLVKSDPINPAARRVLASRLAGVTAYTRAAQQYEVSTRLPGAAPLSTAELAGWVRALIGAGELDFASVQLAAWEAHVFGTPDGQAAPAGGADAPVRAVLLRRVLDGEDGGGRQALDRVIAKLSPAAASGDDNAALELAWITALFGRDTQPVADLLRDRDAQDLRYLRASGFVYMREGATDWARRAFEQVAERDAISAYGLAQLTGRDDAGTARQLRQVIADFPDSFGAALAAHRLHTQGRDVLPTPAGRGVVDTMNRLPSTLWAFDTARNPWVGVRAALNKNIQAQLEPLWARITLQNHTKLALPLGDANTVGPNAVVSVSTYIGGRPLGPAPPIVADLGGRLMLMPGERLTYDVRLDRSRFGLGLARTFPASVTFNSTFIVAPELAANGGFTTGPLGGIDTVRSAQVIIEPPTPENTAAWIQRLTTAPQAGTLDDRSRFATLARVGASHKQMQAAGVEEELSAQAVEALNGAFAAGDEHVQAFTLLTLSATDDARSPFRPLYDLAVRSEADVVRVAHLAAHVTDPLAPSLISAVRDGSPRLRRFAEALAESLKVEPISTGANGR